MGKTTNEQVIEEMGRVSLTFEAMQRAMAEMGEAMRNQGTAIEEHKKMIGELGLLVQTLDARLDEQRAALEARDALIEDLVAKVEGRNKSAPTKRNMTDDDARRVLNGALKDKPHKEAAEEIGLTYAQVYSCRLEYTFKHVLKELRDAGWKNPFKGSKK